MFPVRSSVILDEKLFGGVVKRSVLGAWLDVLNAYLGTYLGA